MFENQITDAPVPVTNMTEPKTPEPGQAKGALSWLPPPVPFSLARCGQVHQRLRSQR